MNLRRVAEWCGLAEWHWGAGQQIKQFDPLNNSDDAFHVLAKLWMCGVLVHDEGDVLFYKHHDPVKCFRSETIVTDDASLRRAIVEIAEKVSEA